MMYQIEFLRYIDGRSDPEITQRISGEFPTLQAAIDRGAMLFGAMQGLSMLRDSAFSKTVSGLSRIGSRVSRNA
jgi:hypothetical protein